MGSEHLSLRLLGSFSIAVAGRTVSLPVNAKRLLSYLALRPRPLDRLLVAASLWLDTTEAKARSNLRTTLWRARQVDHGLIDCRGEFIRIGSDVSVDVHELVRAARQLAEDGDVDAAGLPDVALLTDDLLPEWGDDWVLLERERVRQLRLHALEALSRHYTRAGRHGSAIEAAWLAVATEPLRETSHRVLIEAHLAEGNLIEAWRQLARYRELLAEELGIEPSAALVDLVARRGGPVSS